MLGTMGGILRATGSHDVNVVRKVKNQQIASQINSGLDRNAVLTGQGEDALGGYIAKYLANQGKFERAGNEEAAAASQFYNGGMNAKLEALRNRRAAAMTDAANRASAYAIRGINQGRVGNEGSGSSYDTRQALRNVTDVQTQAALDNANQERQDLGYVTGNQLGLAGVREKILNDQAQYGLQPQGVARGMQSANTEALKGLTNLDQANTFYGLKKPTNVAADIFDSMDSGMGGLIGMAGSLTGGGGGGMSRGGRVRGPGTGTSDSIPIRVSDGEFVVNEHATRIPGVMPLLRYINDLGHRRGGGMNFRYGGRARGYESGGMVFGPSSQVGDQGGGKSLMSSGGTSGAFGMAHDLGQRAYDDSTNNFIWPGVTMVPDSGGMASPVGQRQEPLKLPKLRTATPNYNYENIMREQYGDESVPSNFADLHPDAQKSYYEAYDRARALESSWGGVNPYE